MAQERNTTEKNITPDTDCQSMLAGLATITVTSDPAEVDEWVSTIENDAVVGVAFTSNTDDSVEEEGPPEEEGGEPRIITTYMTNHRIAVFQLAVLGRCLVARVHAMQTMPAKLIELMGSNNVKKAMCGFTSRALSKLSDCDITLCHYMDLGDMERRYNKEASKKELVTLCEETFAPRPFGACQQDSPWETDNLTRAQVLWAASQALGCAHVYKAHEERVSRMVRRFALGCPDCDRYFSSPKSLDHHKQVAHGYPPPFDPNAHYCPKCVKHFRSATALVQHIEVCHPEHPLKRPDTSDGEQHSFFCATCEAVFRTQDDLTHHQHTTSHDMQKYVCETCDRRFSTRSALDMHYDVTHSHPGEPVHQCVMCRRSFTTLDALYQHQQCVGHSLSQMCNVCAASFESKQTLQAHYTETGHHEFYLCGSCPKKFADKDALSKHEHSTEHFGGGKASEMPPFHIRRSMMRRNTAEYGRRGSKLPVPKQMPPRSNDRPYPTGASTPTSRASTPPNNHPQYNPPPAAPSAFGPPRSQQQGGGRPSAPTAAPPTGAAYPAPHPHTPGWNHGMFAPPPQSMVQQPQTHETPAHYGPMQQAGYHQPQQQQWNHMVASQPQQAGFMSIAATPYMAPNLMSTPGCPPGYGPAAAFYHNLPPSLTQVNPQPHEALSNHKPNVVMATVAPQQVPPVAHGAAHADAQQPQQQPPQPQQQPGSYPMSTSYYVPPHPHMHHASPQASVVNMDPHNPSPPPQPQEGPSPPRGVMEHQPVMSPDRSSPVSLPYHRYYHHSPPPPAAMGMDPNYHGGGAQTPPPYNQAETGSYPFGHRGPYGNNPPTTPPHNPPPVSPGPHTHKPVPGSSPLHPQQNNTNSWYLSVASHDLSPSPELPFFAIPPPSPDPPVPTTSGNTGTGSAVNNPSSPYYAQLWAGATEPYDASPSPRAPFYYDLGFASPTTLVQPYVSARVYTPPKGQHGSPQPGGAPVCMQHSHSPPPPVPPMNTAHNPYAQ